MGGISVKLKWTAHDDLSVIRKPTVAREEFLEHLTFRSNRGPIFTEIFGPIIGLKEEWEEQGATPEELDFSAFPYRCHAQYNVPIVTGRLGGYPEVTIDDTEDCRIFRDELGRTMKLPRKVATLPMPLDFPVRTMDDWFAIRPWYEFSEARLQGDWEAASRRAREEGAVVSVSIPGGFDEPRQLMGEERLCMAYLEQPELVHDILDTICKTVVAVLDRVSAKSQIDLLFVHEDMAGKSGPLAGPAQVEEFIKPYYRSVWDMLFDRGARVFDQDSDGDMNAVIPAFLEAGVNCMHPMEPAANMDIVRVRAQYGARLAFKGGIDKYVLQRNKEDILAEIEYKVPPMVASGGCVLALDHRIPNGTPIENYRYYVATMWEVMNREAAKL
ncbi:MAG: uroporphyrinogen decarboxylase family protein [Candidatus Hydrogenedentales bacterium]